MKKKLTYLMLPVVIAIWGIIFYRIFYAAGERNVAVIKEERGVDVTKRKFTADTFDLIADYRDPFLGKAAATEQKAASSPVSTQKSEHKPSPSVILWPSVSYSGMIKNQSSAVQLVLLQVNGNSHTVKAGEVVEGIKIMKVYKDSVEVSFGKEKRVFKK